MKKIITILSLFLMGASVYAQTGTIRGNIKDAKTGEAIIGGTVVIQGTSIGSATDVDGKFSIGNLKPGTYSLVISFISYKTDTISNIIVASNKITLINTSLEEEARNLQEVVITGERQKTTEVALISEIKLAQQIATGISAQQIAKTPDRDAAQIMQRVPGVTINDNRFVMIRGVGERYNSVLINDAIAPNTEIDSKSFSFDLIPSNMIERMLILKSGSADLPGDFAGGVVKIYTLGNFSGNITNLSIGTGVRVGTTFNKNLHSKGSGTDFLGFDNGLRSLPNNFPGNARDISGKELETAGKSLKNNFALQESTFLPELKLGLTVGRKFNLGNVKTSNFTSINYSNTYQYLQVNRFRYEEFKAEEGRSPKLQEFKDDNYSRNVRLGIVHNWRFEFSPTFKIEFKNLFNQLSEDETVLREAVYNFQRPNDIFQNYAYRYISKSIYSSQLQGVHNFGEGRSSYTWTVGYNLLSRNEPDYRRFRTYKQVGSEEPYSLIMPASSNIFDNGRFYSKLNESGVMNRGDYEHKFGNNVEEKSISIKTGYYAEYKQRNFNARYITYVIPGFVDPAEGEKISRLPIDQIFESENVNNTDGFKIDEGTSSTDNYNASNVLGAAYIGVSIPLKKFTISSGIRGEYTKQNLNTEAVKDVVDLEILRPLPFLNASYDLNDKALIRLAYSRTLNRPEFRELAGFVYYDFNMDVVYVGNPKLTVADINNLDLRWEYYPREGETISLGVFYKGFNNPIETQASSIGDGLQYSFVNADHANNYGIELEVRKSFNDFFESSFLSNLSIILNASYIYSEVDYGNLQLNQDKKRALQGQAPYIINSSIFYNDIESGVSSGLIYNIVGPRIFFVGTSQFPTVYEMPRHSIDFTFSKSFSKRVEAKFSATDILNAKFRFTQDSNRDTKITSIDESIFSYRRGMGLNLGLTYKF